MLYLLHEFNRAAFLPMLHTTQFAERMVAASGWPLNKLPGVKQAAANCGVRSNTIGDADDTRRQC